MTVSAPKTEELRAFQALRLYRYLSWALTSGVYLLNIPVHALPFGAGVVATLLLAGHIATLFYQGAGRTAKPVVLAETFGIALLLIPTGGVDSPFVWYALNPIFTAALMLSARYCWFVLASFLAAATSASVLLFRRTMDEVWTGKSWFLLVFLLITAAASVFSYLMIGLRKSYSELSVAYQESERLLGHTSALYQALESFAGEHCPRHLASILAVYAGKLTDGAAAACLLNVNDALTLECAIEGNDCSQVDISMEMYSVWDTLQDQQHPQPVRRAIGESTGSVLLCAPVRADSTLHGVLAAYIASEHSMAGAERSVSFLANLGALALERRKSEDLASCLIVAEEQSRIANEIHDGVSQNLFSMVYALHALSQKHGSLHDPETQDQLKLLRRTANEAARELRASIYRISPSKRGDQIFVSTLSSYLSDLEKLNGIKVNLETEGSEEAVSPALRQALFRIVKEASANAMRHGQCGRLDVRLLMQPGRLQLIIADDGIGFDPEHLGNKGLGTVNMQGLMMSFGGSFKIETTPGAGTRVVCSIP